MWRLQQLSSTTNHCHYLLLWVISYLFVASSVRCHRQRHDHMSCCVTSSQCRGKSMVYMSPSYFVRVSPYGLLFTLLCSNNLYIYLAWNISPDTYCCCVVAVTPYIKNILSSPMGSQKNTWEHEQKNKGTGLEFFPLQNLRVLKGNLAAPRAFMFWRALESRAPL